jgi:hypothetical protein
VRGGLKEVVEGQGLVLFEMWKGICFVVENTSEMGCFILYLFEEARLHSSYEYLCQINLPSVTQES